MGAECQDKKSIRQMEKNGFVLRTKVEPKEYTEGVMNLPMFYSAMETAEVDIQIYLPPLPVLNTEEGS